MGFGSTGAIAHIDLSTARIEIEHPDEAFYRKYLGGGLLGAYYLLRHMLPGADPLGPDNVLVFAPGVCTGQPVSGLSRFSVTAKSPLGGAIGESQAGGYWGPELKFAGFDAVVITGRASSPVYLWIHENRVEIMPAEWLWGLDAGDAQERIRSALGDDRIRAALIGPGGENRVRFACIVNDNRHFNGRCGMGAVMGAKNLKAVAVRGHTAPRCYDRGAVARLARLAPQLVQANTSVQMLSDLGTDAWMTGMDEEGSLPTRNFSQGTFEGAADISMQHFRELGLYEGTGTCYACVVHCKQVLKAKTPVALDAAYGAPEYESAAALGAYLGVSDPYVVAQANELCSRYTLDTISTGAALAFAMECYEAGILTREQTNGLELRFGNADVVLPLIEMIARRHGLGNLLAEGTQRAAQALGGESHRFAMQVKGVDLPAHLPHGKQSLALAYATLPYGADHCSAEHDYLIAPGASATARERAQVLGLASEVELAVLNSEKVRLFRATQRYRGFLECLSVCHYCYALSYLFSPDQVVHLVQAVTGWDVSLEELLRAGERRVTLQRAFNAREGIDRAADALPERFFEPLGGVGPNAGRRIDPQALHTALTEYYESMGWDPASGNPMRARLAELGLDWVADDLDRRGALPGGQTALS
jgi:aldehyde:ferredoxin oxidoreductase